MTSQSAIFIL